MFLGSRDRSRLPWEAPEGSQESSKELRKLLKWWMQEIIDMLTNVGLISAKVLNDFGVNFGAKTTQEI